MKKTSFLAILVMIIALQAAAAEVDRDQIQLAREILRFVYRLHYHPHELNNDLSERVYKTFLSRLDFRKRFLLQEDINVLNSYEKKIDDELAEIRGWDNFAFYIASRELYEKRVREIQQEIDGLLAQPFDYGREDYLELDPDKTDWCLTPAARTERWRKMLRYEVVQRYFTLLETENKTVDGQEEGVPEEVALLDNGRMIPEYEQKAREKIRSRYERILRRLLEQTDDDYFSLYLNSVLNSFDPHTVYMPPINREDFDIDMTGQFEGIGARLSEEEGYIKVTEIIPGSASWRQGELQPEDIILKVGEPGEEPVDVVDMPIRDAVKYIRGEKGTEVRLTVRRPTGEICVIPIVRDVVVIEETYAKYVLLENERLGKSFGYIKLPKFYRDFSDSGSRNATDDVANALEYLKQQGIAGVVLDLRNNGGGALTDAVDIAGLFIEDGPVVQVSQSGSGLLTDVHRDTDSRVQYDGPLVVLVNQFSASASEILAAALQDYDRAIVIGPNRSFGKGTVQNLIDFNRWGNLRFTTPDPLGSLKLTIQKFFRIDGGTTQYNGVIPDINLPGYYDYLDIGEREYDYSLKPDSINAVPFSEWQDGKLNRRRFAELSKKRVMGDPVFSSLKERNDRLRMEREETRTSLAITDMVREHREAQKEADFTREMMEEMDWIGVVRTPELPRFKDKTEEETYTDWVTNLRKDVTLAEAMNVLNDMLGK